MTEDISVKCPHCNKTLHVHLIMGDLHLVGVSKLLNAETNEYE